MPPPLFLERCGQGAAEDEMLSPLTYVCPTVIMQRRRRRGRHAADALAGIASTVPGRRWTVKTAADPDAAPRWPPPIPRVVVAGSVAGGRSECMGMGTAAAPPRLNPAPMFVYSLLLPTVALTGLESRLPSRRTSCRRARPTSATRSTSERLEDRRSAVERPARICDELQFFADFMEIFR